jgi:hypothetical protein
MDSNEVDEALEELEEVHAETLSLRRDGADEGDGSGSSSESRKRAKLLT